MHLIEKQNYYIILYYRLNIKACFLIFFLLLQFWEFLFKTNKQTNNLPVGQEK